MDLNKDEHSVVAFYGFEGTQELLKRAFDFCQCIFEKLGQHPNLMGINGEKTKRIEQTRKKVTANRFAGIDSFDVSYIDVPVEPGKHEGPVVSFRISMKEDRIFSHVNICSSLCRLDSQEFLEIVKELARLLIPCYGIGYRMESGYAADFYAEGLWYGRPEERASKVPKEEGGWIAGMLKKAYRHGLLRSVYSLNFLTTCHLNSLIRNSTLLQWIKSDTNHGTLCPLTEQTTLWRVADEHLPDVRKTLWEAGLIFDQRRHLLQPTPPGPKPTGEQVLGQVLNAMGYTPEEAHVLKVEKPGQTRELSTEEVQAIQGKAKKPRKTDK